MACADVLAVGDVLLIKDVLVTSTLSSVTATSSTADAELAVSGGVTLTVDALSLVTCAVPTGQLGYLPTRALCDPQY